MKQMIKVILINFALYGSLAYTMEQDVPVVSKASLLQNKLVEFNNNLPDQFETLQQLETTTSQWHYLRYEYSKLQKTINQRLKQKITHQELEALSQQTYDLSSNVTTIEGKVASLQNNYYAAALLGTHKRKKRE